MTSNRDHDHVDVDDFAYHLATEDEEADDDLTSERDWLTEFSLTYSVGMEQQAEDDEETQRQQDGSPTISQHFWSSPSQLTAMISNFSTAYNVVNIALVLPILETLDPGNYTEEDVSACASALLAGMMVGQLMGGLLGDSVLGRLGALRLVMAVQIVASLGSALVPSSGNVWMPLAIWRFCLGIGCGGVYPLAAIISAEEGNNHTDESGGIPGRNERSSSRKSLEKEEQEKVAQMRRVVLTFSMQGVGFIAVPVVTVLLLYILGEPYLGLIWRLILGLGCLPGIILVCVQFGVYKQTDTPPERLLLAETDNISTGNELPLMLDPHSSDSHISDSPARVQLEEEHRSALDFILRDEPKRPPQHTGWWDSIRTEPNLGQKLLGTAGTWFLFDVLFYGNTLFLPVVMEAAFGDSQGSSSTTSAIRILQNEALSSLAVTAISVPGLALSVLVIGKKTCTIIQTPRYIQLQGFFAMGLLYAIIGIFWNPLKSFSWLLVILYGLTFFFSNYGPNTTTFTLPSLLYSHDCRSTLNGISAAAGKSGALLGATLFSPAATSIGDDHVMLICSAVSALAFILTYYCVRPPTNDADSARL